MSLVEHLAELRRRLIISALALVAGALVGFLLYNWILELLIEPYTAITGKTRLLFTDPVEGFTTRLKVSAYVGLFLASPVVLWQLWRFITPGLHKHEKRYAIPFILCSVSLFVLGGVVAMLTFEPALRFLIGVGGDNLDPLFTASRYLSLLMLMIVAFGVAFELPILLVFLQLAGVVSSRKLRSWRRPALVIVVAAAAILTPSGDPYSLLAMAVPLYVFFEGAILVGRLLKK